MIQELSAFVKELKNRYGEGEYIKEVTITSRAAEFIPHIAPKPGEFLDIFVDTSRVRVWNGGDEHAVVKRHQTTSAFVTDGGYPYKILDEVPGFIRGEVFLPTGEWIDISWDSNGNVFSIGDWPGNLRALCRLPIAALQKEIEEAAKEPIHEVTAQLGHSNVVQIHPLSLICIEEAAPEVGSVGTIMAEAPTPPEVKNARTVAGYEAVILEKRAMGFLAGIVQLPNGEMVGATWDSDGDDLDGRPKFKLVKDF